MERAAVRLPALRGGRRCAVARIPPPPLETIGEPRCRARRTRRPLVCCTGILPECVGCPRQILGCRRTGRGAPARRLLRVVIRPNSRPPQSETRLRKIRGVVCPNRADRRVVRPSRTYHLLTGRGVDRTGRCPSDRGSLSSATNSSDSTFATANTERDRGGPSPTEDRNPHPLPQPAAARGPGMRRSTPLPRTGAASHRRDLFESPSGSGAGYRTVRHPIAGIRNGPVAACRPIHPVAATAVDSLRPSRAAFGRTKSSRRLEATVRTSARR